MSAWDWTMLLGALASIAGVVLYFRGRASSPPPPPVERFEPTHPEPESPAEPAPQPTGNQITATNVKDSDIIGGSRGTQPRNPNPNEINVTNSEGSTSAKAAMTNPDGNRIDATNLDGSTIIGGDNHGMTVAEHERLLASQITTLEAKHTEIVAQMLETQAAKADAAAAQLELLQHKLETTTAQLAETRRRAENPEKSLADMRTRIAELEKLLEHSTVEIGENRLKFAHDALAKGDFTEADAIFAEVQQHEQRAVERYAEAAYGQGLIAEQEVRWNDAARHYEIAAQKLAKPEYLTKADEFLWRSGNERRAVRFAEDYLQAINKIHGSESAEAAIALKNLALKFKRLGNDKKAEPLYRHAIEIGRPTSERRIRTTPSASTISRVCCET